MEWFLLPFKKYADFEGRSRRKEYWMFVLIHLLIFISIISLIGFVNLDKFLRLYMLVHGLIFIIPAFSLWTRRLHDVGKSGLYFFVRCIPFIGGIWFFILMCTEGDKGTNKYGLDPKNPINELNDIRGNSRI